MWADLLIPIRWLHVISATAWFGEVVVINIVLIPVLSRFEVPELRLFLGNVFPRLFRLASVLSATAVLSGIALLLIMTRGDLSMLAEGRWGISILFGGSLGTALTLFHFFMENRLAERIGIGCDGQVDDVLHDVHVKLKFVPRAGMVVITTIFLSMMYAVRGI